MSNQPVLPLFESKSVNISFVENNRSSKTWGERVEFGIMAGVTIVALVILGGASNFPLEALKAGGFVGFWADVVAWVLVLSIVAIAGFIGYKVGMPFQRWRQEQIRVAVRENEEALVKGFREAGYTISTYATFENISSAKFTAIDTGVVYRSSSGSWDGNTLRMVLSSTP